MGASLHPEEITLTTKNSGEHNPGASCLQLHPFLRSSHRLRGQNSKVGVMSGLATIQHESLPGVHKGDDRDLINEKGNQR